MAKVKELLRSLFVGRLACSPLMTVAAASAAATHEQTIVGASQLLELGQGDAPPEWVRLIPAGTFQLNDGRGPFHNPSPDEVIANTRTALAGRDANGDYDHATEYTAKTGAPALASGWIKDWRVTAGAIEARVQWTALAARRIRGREYRYVSPVFDTDKKTGRVVRVRRFALTNDPAIDDLPAIAAAAQPSEENDVSLAKLIASALGLAETATEAELVTGVTTLRQRHDQVVAASGLKADASTDTIVAALRAQPDAAKWIAASEYQRVTGELTTVTAARDALAQKVTGAETATVIADAIKAGKLTPAQKPYWEKVCAAAGSAEPLQEFLKTAVVIVRPGEEPRREGDPDVITAATLSDEQKAYCAQHNIDPKAFAAELTKIVAASAA